MSAIEVNILQEDTPLPNEMGSFWASSSSKVNLLNLLRLFIITHADKKLPVTEVILNRTGITG